MQTEDVFEQQFFTRDEKKRIRDHADYYRKNREMLLAKIHQQGISFNVYDVVPIREYFDFEYKVSHSVMANIFVDRNNFTEKMAETLYMYEYSATPAKVSKETGRPIVIPYTDTLFLRFFILKLITVPCYQIPLLLDHHYPKYFDETSHSPKQRKFDFLQLVEFQVIDLLERFSPFNYELQGIEVVKWLREKKKKYGNLSPEEILDNIKARQNTTESKGLVELTSLIPTVALDHFRGMETRFKKAGYIKEDTMGKTSWAKTKDEIMAFILLMNKHKYFGRDLFEKSNKKFKEQVKAAFEHRFSIQLTQNFEPARIKKIDLQKYEKLKPFSTIAPPISFDKI